MELQSWNRLLRTGSLSSTVRSWWPTELGGTSPGLKNPLQLMQVPQRRAKKGPKQLQTAFNPKLNLQAQINTNCIGQRQETKPPKSRSKLPT